MSFLRCEDGPLYTSVCDSATVEQFSTVVTEGSNSGVSAPLYVDLRHAPFKQMCLTVSAPLTVTNTDDSVYGVSVGVQLFRGRSVDIANLVDSNTLYATLPNGDVASSTSLTPVLLHRVAPGEYTVRVNAASSSANSFSVFGRINVCATLTQLVL
jgi:hypothetical protein